MQITIESFMVTKRRLTEVCPPLGDGPPWVDHVVKVNGDTYLVVDVEDFGDALQVYIQPAPFL
jgi:hypothetical protein